MILKHRALYALTVILLLAAPGVTAGAQDDPIAVARRLGAVTAIAGAEYALGVRDGRVVSAAELEEARLFLGEARRLAAALPPEARPAAMERVGALLAAAEALVAPAILDQAIADLRDELAGALGIALDPLPAAPVALGRGAAVYGERCAACHGDRGDGRGPAADGLDPPPADLTDRPALSGSSPLDFFRKISVGVAGTAMAGYEQALSLEDRWAVALYTSGLRHARASRADGRRWLAARCADCLVEVSDGIALLAVPDDSLAARLAAAAGGPLPPEVIAFARTAGAADVLGADRGLAARRAVRRAEALVAEAEGRGRAGDRAGALGSAFEAYAAFEATEREIGARSGRAVGAVERAFGRFRAAIGAGDSAATAAAAAGLRTALGRAAETTAAGGAPAVLFGQSLLIILREGLEALLIIGALTAFLHRAGAPERKRQLAVGAGLAVAASIAVAGLFAGILRGAVAQQETVEGVTMLLASVVLFGVASWMVSKVEAERWQAFVRARVQDALSGGSALALAGVAFLAVFREGVETILFYAALLGTAGSGMGVVAVWTGFVAGAAVLALLYVGMQRWGMRIPVRPFFAVTGALLTVMAVSFAGQGVAELQAAGWVPATPLRLPALPALGVFPTVQTTLAQVTLAVAFGIALLWVFRGGRAVARAR